MTRNLTYSPTGSPLGRSGPGLLAAWIVVGSVVLAGAGCDKPTLTPVQKGPAAVFSEVAAESGIDFQHSNGATGLCYLLEIMSGGGAFLDYDGDGNLDVYLVQSGVFGQANGPTGKLYRNLGAAGNYRFKDVTAESGTGIDGYGMGCAAADYDRDGDVDMYITRVGADVLLENLGDGSFRDSTERSGLGDPGFNSSAAWLDYDRDGDLDLYVCRYLIWSPEQKVTCLSPLTKTEDYCNPTAYERAMDVFYRNNGDGTFTDVTKQVGVTKMGYGLALACGDFDQDGWIDIYVACDQTDALLWHNQKGQGFREVALGRGAARNGKSVAIAGMGVVFEDLDADQDFDLFVTNIRGQNNMFLEQDGGYYSDRSGRWGQPRWLSQYTGFGAVAFDQNNNGRWEMYVANGAVNMNNTPFVKDDPYAEPDNFLRQNETGRFVESISELTPKLQEADVSRGVTWGDYDNDGDVDLLVCRNNDTPLLLRNDQKSDNHWLMVRAVDHNGSAVLNARIVAKVGDLRYLREVRRQQSYLVSGDPRVHIGLGAAAQVDQLTVHWPDGSDPVVLENVSVDQVLEVRKPQN